MKRRLFYRNAQAQDNLELFLVSAVSSLLLLRFYLHATHYPQVGGGNLHIAHMLYGGLFMLIAIMINLAFLGVRAQRLAAFLGGLGFGVFIDEIGKFLTKDNNYFFRPAIGLIYAIFVILYLAINFLTRQQRLTSEEYQLNAMRQFEEAVLHDMDKTEKATMKAFLARADQSSPITRELQNLLKNVATVKADPGLATRARAAITKQYNRFWARRESSGVVGAIFVIQAIVFLIVTLFTMYHNLHTISQLIHSTDQYATRLLIGQLLASVVSAGFALAGALRLLDNRLEAFELFRRATLINIFLTEFFIFSRIQFGAIPGFLVNLALLIALRAAMTQERHS